MLKKWDIEEVKKSDPDQFLSHIFIRSKKDWIVRPILNLKALNESVQHQHFKMEGFQTVKKLLKRGTGW